MFCGRYKAGMLRINTIHDPESILRLPLPFWRAVSDQRLALFENLPGT
jgi:hypothetical protein